MSSLRKSFLSQELDKKKEKGEEDKKGPCTPRSAVQPKETDFPQVMPGSLSDFHPSSIPILDASGKPVLPRYLAVGSPPLAFFSVGKPSTEKKAVTVCKNSSNNPVTVSADSTKVTPVTSFVVRRNS